MPAASGFDSSPEAAGISTKATLGNLCPSELLSSA